MEPRLDWAHATSRYLSSDEPSALARLSSELAHALVHRLMSHSESRAVCGHIRRARAAATSEIRVGYLGALEDIVGATIEAVEERDERGAVVGRVRGHATMKTLVVALLDGPRTPTELARETPLGANNGGVSKALGELQSLGVVEAAESVDGRQKPRRLTALGYRIGDEIRSAEALEQEQAAADRAEEPAASSEDMVSAIGAAVQLLTMCKSLERRELHACATFNRVSPDLLDKFAVTLERRGVVNLTRQGDCFWGRASKPGRLNIVSLFEKDRSSVQNLFREVPRPFCLWTDRIDDWRDVLAEAGISDVDVLSPALGGRLSADTTVVVDDDDTIVAYQAKAGRQLLFELIEGSQHCIVKPVASERIR